MRVWFALVWLLVTPVSASEAVLDARTGALIAGWDVDAPRRPASTTKLMTIHLALEAVRNGDVELDQAFTVSRHAAAAPPVRLGLSEGDQITLAQAIHAALILSSNDAARVVAEAVAGSEAAFASKMTNAARAMGMTNTRFVNASGLPDEGHISTAADIALLALFVDQRHGRYLRPLFRAPLKWRGAVLRPRNAAVASRPNAKLGKTGFTCAAGYTAVVVLGSPDREIVAATMANPNPSARAISLSRLAEASSNRRPASGACRTSRSPRRAMPDWSLTLGVFAERKDALQALKKGRKVAAKARRAIAVRETRSGFYAMMFADDRKAAEALRFKLRDGGVNAQIIDPAGKQALRLKILGDQ